MRERNFRPQMVALIKELKKQIGDEYRASDDSTRPSMSVTVGADADGWSYQTGDNSYTGGAYGYATWAVVEIDRRSNSRSAADDIVRQLFELQDEDALIFTPPRKRKLTLAALDKWIADTRAELLTCPPQFRASVELRLVELTNQRKEKQS